MNIICIMCIVCLYIYIVSEFVAGVFRIRAKDEKTANISITAYSIGIVFAFFGIMLFFAAVFKGTKGIDMLSYLGNVYLHFAFIISFVFSFVVKVITKKRGISYE